MLEVLTGILVFITAFYAWATFRILRANERVVDVMKQQADAMTRPYVQIIPIIKPGNPFFYLNIINLGKSSAYDLRLAMDRKVYQHGEISDKSDFASFPAFSQPIDSFPPGAKIEFILANANQYVHGKNEENLPPNFCVTAEYSFQDTTVKEKNKIDLRPYFYSTIPQDQYTQILKKISDSLAKIALWKRL